jgi:hypothetical protein
VKKEDDFATDLLLQPSRGGDFRVKKSLWKEAARLLTEADDRIAHDIYELPASWPVAGRDGAPRRPGG